MKTMFDLFTWSDLDFKIKPVARWQSGESFPSVHEILKFQEALDLFIKAHICENKAFADIGVPQVPVQSHTERLVFERDRDISCKIVKMNIERGRLARSTIFSCRKYPLKYDQF